MVLKSALIGACALAFSVSASYGDDLLSLIPAEFQRTFEEAKPSAPSVEEIPQATDVKVLVPEKAVVVEKPVVVEKEVVVENPVVVEKEIVVEKPVVVEKEVVVEKPVVVEKEVVVEKPVVVEKTVVQTVTNEVERVVEKPVVVEKTVVQTVTNEVERVVEKPVVVEKTVVQTVTNVVEREIVVERPVTNLVDRIVERHVTNTVERIVEKEITNTVEKVVSERELRRRELTGRPAKITSKSTYYNRKEGVAFFNRDVYVDDEQYQLHADKAYVFMGASNEVKRIVAIGNVAFTNELRRAYGDTVTYYRASGLVVLKSGNGIAAEVCDDSKTEDQIVRGEKIKFWIGPERGQEQVEVIQADITAPTKGGGLKDLTGSRKKK